MIIADYNVGNAVKVFGVLTDLKDVWNILWLTVNKKIAMVCLTNVTVKSHLRQLTKWLDQIILELKVFQIQSA